MSSTKDSAIRQFSGPYRFLSNFYEAAIPYEGIVYPSAEHAYQAAKTLDVNMRRRVSELPQAGEAKRFGKTLPLRSDWETVKLGVMEKIVTIKFRRHDDLRERLLDTGDRHLEEGNTWGDVYWGSSNGDGMNNLGIILMRVRDKLKQEVRANTSL
jgi:ribA/ribD-fused uncharacterized protein